MYPRIALYHDEASGERYEEKAFHKTGVVYDKIGPSDMVLDRLEDYDVVFLPGAFPLKRHGKGGFVPFLRFLKRIAVDYKPHLLDYIRSGGGVIAVCASVACMGYKTSIPLPVRPYFMGRKPLRVFDFYAKYGPKTGVVDLEPLDYSGSPKARRIVGEVLGDYSEEQFSSLYFRGPALSYDKKLDILHPSIKADDPSPTEVVVAKYLDEDPQLKNKGAIVYREFGEGSSISCSVHPEFSTWDLFDSMIDVVARN
ncbi:MAG: hypothetical protein ACMUFK_00885 [Thermoplasmatota archaeon]